MIYCFMWLVATNQRDRRKYDAKKETGSKNSNICAGSGLHDITDRGGLGGGTRGDKKGYMAV